MAEKLKYTQQTSGTSFRNTRKSIDTYEAKKYHFFKSKDDLQKEKSSMMCIIY